MSKKIRLEPELADLSGALVACLKQAGRPLALDAILRILRLPRKAKRDVQETLRELTAAGTLVRAADGHAFAGKLKEVTGVLSAVRSGAHFLTRTGGARDIYIHPANLGDARHGDTVRALLLPGSGGSHPEGRVLGVLRRGLLEVPVMPVRPQSDGTWLCTPASARLQTLFVVNVSTLAAPPRPGGLLLVHPGDSLGPNLCAAEAVADLNDESSPTAQERLVKSLHAAPGPFPPDVLEEAVRLPEDPAEADFAGRKDLRPLSFVTIDGEDAKDFDDAVYAEERDGGFRLLVAVADVSAAVPEGSALDREAARRGNSWYFPRSVEPMLPQALSNGLCSLRPGVPRLVMVADLDLAGDGRVLRADFSPAVIRSVARLTYTQVKAGLLAVTPNTGAAAPAPMSPEAVAPMQSEAAVPTTTMPAQPESVVPALPETVVPMLRVALHAARALAETRKQRGALDFDLPEPGFSFDAEGKVAGVRPQERHWGHRLIEEFMITANEAVARFLRAANETFPYRLHQAPDGGKLEILADYLSATSLWRRPEKSGRGGKGRRGGAALPDVRAVLHDVAGTPQEYAVNRLVLRSMMQARYSPEAEGHYGLASECYCHFTSPIRRYADLMVHRALKHALGLPGYAPPPSFVRQERICEDLNACERAAVDAEREIRKRLSVLFLRERIGEDMDGIISSVTDFGMFVELPEVLCEGMVRLGFLTDDYYEYIPERQELRGRGTRRVFRPGDPLRVRLVEASLARLEIDLAPAYLARRKRRARCCGRRERARPGPWNAVGLPVRTSGGQTTFRQARKIGRHLPTGQGRTIGTHAQAAQGRKSGSRQARAACDSKT